MKTILLILSATLFLSSGVISESSTNVPSTTPATPTCTNGKVFNSCGTMCPLTCDNKDNPPMICPMACKIGCECPSGKVENGDMCVSPEDCPATNATAEPVCTNGKVHTTCGSACPLTCANMNNPPSCIQECVTGCFCPDNKVISNEGSCVDREACPGVSVKPSHCQLPPVAGLCKASIPSFFYNSTSMKCESFIYGGCGGNDNRFSSKETCMESCGDNQTTTSPTATATDANFNAPYIEPPLQCPETEAEPFGACVIQSECMNIESGSVGGCGEGHLCCSTGCGGILCNEGVTPSPLCAAVRAKATNESSGLLGAYIPQCEKDGSFSKVQCHEGLCWCVDSESGKALGVAADRGVMPQCDEDTATTPSPTTCTNGKVFNSCGTMCPLTCDNKDNPPMICPLACRIGCECPQGKVENGDMCVSPDECPATTTATATEANFNAPYIEPPLQCPETEGETFGACVIQSECMNIESGSVGGCGEGYLCCSTGCGGILCNEGVTPSPLCAAVRAKATNESSGLLGAYIPQCEKDGSFSKVQCHEGLCWCVDSESGKALGVAAAHGVLPQCDEDTATTPSPTKTTTCTNGKVFNSCGTMCPLTCDNKDNPPMICPLACKIGCECPQGKVENGDMCVSPDECPATTTATTTSASKPSYCQLSPVSGLCEAYMPSFFYNSTSMKCESFVYGGCGGNQNRFETKSSCMETCGEAQVTESNVPTVSEPETLTEAVYSAQKMCPSVGGAAGLCEEQCTSDEDCEDWEKCCSNGCGHSCMETTDVPYYTAPMQCPVPLLPICNFHFACSSHDECSDQYCCSTGCGAMCMTGVTKTPACSAILESVQSKGLIGAYEPQCDDNGNFTALQCHASTGMCWCVDKVTGKPLTAPVTAQQPECEQMVQEDKCKGIMCDWPYCGEDVQPITDDDHCCPYCPADCKVGEQSYPSGTSYTAPDGCNTCSCYNGMSACTLMACLNQCTYNGKKYNPGQSFNSTDGCNTCQCDSNGGVACTERACLYDCNAGGIKMREGEKKDDGCSECICQNKKITCTESAKGCTNPKTASIDITMKFNADFDAISDNLEEFKASFKMTLLTKYQHLNLHESQIIINEVYRGSVVVTITIHDRMDTDDDDDDDDDHDHHGHHGDHDHTGDDDDDDDDEPLKLANVTLLIVQLEQDYMNNDLGITYQDQTFEPSGDFSYQNSDDGDDEDDDEGFFWMYAGVLSVLIALMLTMVVVIMVTIIKRRRRARRCSGMSPLPTRDEFDDYKVKGFSNPVYATKSTTVNM